MQSLAMVPTPAHLAAGRGGQPGIAALSELWPSQHKKISQAIAEIKRHSKLAEMQHIACIIIVSLPQVSGGPGPRAQRWLQSFLISPTQY